MPLIEVRTRRCCLRRRRGQCCCCNLRNYNDCIFLIDDYSSCREESWVGGGGEHITVLQYAHRQRTLQRNSLRFPSTTFLSFLVGKCSTTVQHGVIPHTTASRPAAFRSLSQQTAQLANDWTLEVLAAHPHSLAILLFCSSSVTP